MNLKKFKNFLTLATSKIIILIFLFNQTAFSKPVPPGSGAGDVSVNILILLDNSLSMNRKTITGDAINLSGGLAELTGSNDIIAAQRNMGLSKINYDTGVRDRDFAENGYFRGKASDSDCGGKDSTITTSQNLAIYNDEVYALNYENKTLVRVNSSGVCQEVIDLGFNPRTVLVVGDHLFVGGITGSNTPHFWTKNLATSDDITCSAYYEIGKSWSTTADASLSYFYYSYHNRGYIGRVVLNAVGNNYCPSNSRSAYYTSAKNNNKRHRNATRIAIDPENDNIIFVTSWKYHSIDRMQISGTGNNALRRQQRKGTKGRQASTASKIKFRKAYGLFVSARNDRVYVSSDKPSIQGFADSNLAWNKEIGGSTLTRMVGAKEAINAIFDDSSLTSGAHFGFGWWSAKNKKAHKGKGNPNYFSGWNGLHPAGKSGVCNKGSCIIVGVGPNGADDAPKYVKSLGTIFGTDARAFSELALEYYNKDKSWSPITPDSDCQQSYVIIIGDGEWNQGSIAVSRINTLRVTHKVKTAVVAYGGGISSSGLSKFADVARAGSCGTAGDADCWQTILADDPSALKTQLETIIAQFIAESLSFTAPTITAEIEDKEGDHAIYQAQFNYKQHQEWKGTIIRKSITLEGVVDHDPNATGNWDAATNMPAPDSRKIWTAIPEAPYEENGWNNFTTTNALDIEYLMNLTGEEIVDYHRETADDTGDTKTMRCFGSGEDGSGDIADDIDDDVVGLINFVRGKDYFDYNGNCNLTEERNHILGDVYHSQIVTVGKPKANTGFVGINQEAYFRAKNNYKSHAAALDFRKKPKTLYAGANDGMLHAFNTETGVEMWAFIPPFIVSQLPTVMNANLNRSDGGGSNAIFGVDGSPVIHDMYFEAPHKSGKRWYTIMLLPYGRGGAGFSVLDITHPNQPHHLYSIFNDQINHRVLFANHEGAVTEDTIFDYHGASYDLSHSQEALRAIENQRDAEDAGTEETDSGVYTCSTSSSFLTNDEINNACYKGTSWTFEIPLRADQMTAADSMECFDENLDSIACSYTATGGTFKVSFPSNQIFSAATADETDVEDSTFVGIQFKGPIVGVKNDDGTPHPYDYSQLGETWSTPRIFRLPNDGAGDASILNDIYVAVMGAGKGSSSNGSGSAVYVINLEDEGKIVELPTLKAETETEGRGLIQIEDDPFGNVYNSMLASPVVITPDTTIGIPWTGALVYINDYEGKITKINLTNMETKDSSGKKYNLFHHTTLFKTGSTRANGQYMYFSMDATIGKKSRDVWFFAGTGDFDNITASGHSNKLLGIKDPDYPLYFELPASGRPGIALTDCEETTDHDGDGGVTEPCCADLEDCRGWYINLAGSAKVTGEPTVYKGNVYFPVYKPDLTKGGCNLGAAFICSADDECGYNNSEDLGETTVVADGDAITSDSGFKDDKCLFVGRGILSEIVVFADKLFANIAGPEATEDTLIVRKAAPGEVTTYRSSWRENY